MNSKFPKMPIKEVDALRRSDSVVQSIQASAATITFTWLRERFRQNNGLKDNLKYGTAILSDTAELNQYLYTYGKMIQSQWQNVLAGGKVSDDPIRVIDYGCGQGLGGLIMSDQLGKKFRDKVKEVILVEPSKVAIIRAEAVYRNIFPDASIECYDQELDELRKTQFSASAMNTLHIFSNVLDIPSFEQSNVFNSALTNGEHTIIAVSHNRDFAGGADRIKAIEKEIGKEKYASWVTIRSSDIEEFTCGDGGKFAAISWLANLSIARG